MNKEFLWITVVVVAIVGVAVIAFGQVLQNLQIYAIYYTKYLNRTMTITYDNGTTVKPPPESALYKAHNHESKELELGNST